MIVKTITCHDVYNYGASLQAFALMKYVQNRGHEVEIIDYKPYYLKKRYNFWYIEPQSKFYALCRISKLIHFFYALLHLKQRFATIGRKKPFDEFKTKFLKLTKETYSSNNKLKSNALVADLYIAGSDQIWNTNYQNGKDGSFYLDFVPDGIPCISYAASFGINNISIGFEEFVLHKLRKFHSISVRETTGLKILAALGIKDAIQVLDPVFLISCNYWKQLLKKSHSEKFILVYDFTCSDNIIKEFALNLAHKKNLKVFSINDLRSLHYADKNISNAGPIEFLEYINSAEYVISNSFHATAFSIIFEKQFYVTGLEKHNNSTRMTDFLKLLNIPDRYINSIIDNRTYSNKIDYSEIAIPLKEHINHSMNFLNKYV